MMRLRKLALQEKRRRVAMLVLTVLVIITITVVCISQSNKNSVEAETDTYIEYYVKPGDTLWDIAKEHSNNNVDLREFIREIEEKNQLKGEYIYCGDMLLVSTKYSSE